MNSVGPVLCISSPSSCCVVALELARQAGLQRVDINSDTLIIYTNTESVRNPWGNEQLYFALRFLEGVNCFFLGSFTFSVEH